jgi:hypothetical protein
MLGRGAEVQPVLFAIAIAQLTLEAPAAAQRNQ